MENFRHIFWNPEPICVKTYLKNPLLIDKVSRRLHFYPIPSHWHVLSKTNKRRTNTFRQKGLRPLFPMTHGIEKGSHCTVSYSCRYWGVSPSWDWTTHVYRSRLNLTHPQLRIQLQSLIKKKEISIREEDLKKLSVPFSFSEFSFRVTMRSSW